jgi:hypothetical protein
VERCRAVSARTCTTAHGAVVAHLRHALHPWLRALLPSVGSPRSEAVSSTVVEAHACSGPVWFKYRQHHLRAACPLLYATRCSMPSAPCCPTILFMDEGFGWFQHCCAGVRNRTPRAAENAENFTAMPLAASGLQPHARLPKSRAPRTAPSLLKTPAHPPGRCRQP